MADTPRFIGTASLLRAGERAFEVLPTPIAAVVAEYMTTTASIKTVPEENERRLRRVEDVARAVLALPVPAPVDREGVVTEHAIEMSSGDMKIRNADPEIERIYPLAQWIPAHQRFGGRVWRRRIRVVADWVEVPKGEGDDRG